MLAHQIEVIDVIYTNLTKKVKLADLEHNSDLTRLDKVDSDADRRTRKYHEAIDQLNQGYALKNYCQGGSGDRKFFTTQRNIFMVESGRKYYRMNWDGNFICDDASMRYLDIWYKGEPIDIMPVTEEVALREAEIRKKQSKDESA